MYGFWHIFHIFRFNFKCRRSILKFIWSAVFFSNAHSFFLFILLSDCQFVYMSDFIFVNYFAPIGNLSVVRLIGMCFESTWLGSYAGLSLPRSIFPRCCSQTKNFLMYFYNNNLKPCILWAFFSMVIFTYLLINSGKWHR